MCFHFWLWLFGRYSYTDYEFWNTIKMLCNNCSNATAKKYKTINKKYEKKHDEIVLFAKSKLNSLEVLISKALTDWVISHVQYVTVKNWKLLKSQKLVDY